MKGTIIIRYVPYYNSLTCVWQVRHRWSAPGYPQRGGADQVMYTRQELRYIYNDILNYFLCYTISYWCILILHLLYTLHVILLFSNVCA